jgi:hypothetical protein
VVGSRLPPDDLERWLGCRYCHGALLSV